MFSVHATHCIHTLKNVRKTYVHVLNLLILGVLSSKKGKVRNSSLINNSNSLPLCLFGAI